ncbi:DegV family protein with EDD domain [Mycoplasmoides fastidiosum]|uniref:DegV family protein with EDD domain n=1 Tax=Mycoplasmoides fastidiosum TaxID=92758 RepID=A0ABU0LYB6_9BACT|nr:DegV family protein [Mycoplasmoides fastidiosum]MDQ0513702.1 DegV family protein with EDD domain [Mycoplasmoides fastidiosum]UUD37875.1 DegV family protein [Mycoplasmoides fastidiosum]
MNKKICIMTDTSSTMNEETAKKHGIVLLPLNMIDEAGFDHFNNLSLEVIGRRMESGEFLRTSTTPIGLFVQTIEDLFKQYEKIIYLTLSSKISSQFSQSLNILKTEFGNDNLLVFDSANSGYGLEVLATQLAEQVNKPDFKIEQVSELIRDFRTKNFSYFTCENIKYIARSGRGGKKILKYFGKIIRPVILFTDENSLETISRTLEGAIAKMVAAIAKRLNTNQSIIKKIVIYNGLGKPEIIQNLVSLINEKLEYAVDTIGIVDVPKVVFVHTGPQTYGVYVETL